MKHRSPTISTAYIYLNSKYTIAYNYVEWQKEKSIKASKTTYKYKTIHHTGGVQKQRGILATLPVSS